MNNPEVPTRLAIASPGRTSSGGSAFSHNLVSALQPHLRGEVLQFGVPAQGKISLPPTVSGSDAVVYLGARVAPKSPGRTIFWPLNVAPLERHIDHLPHTSARNRVRNRLLKVRFAQSVGRADALVFGSAHARTLYMSAYPAAARLPYTIIPGGTPSLPALKPRSANPDSASILCVSHLYPYKGIIETVNAFVHALPRLPEQAHLRVAGAARDPRYAAAVHARIAELGVPDRVTVAEADPAEMTTLYAKARLAVFPSLCENAGSFALYDGLHAGVPTVCSDRSSMPEMVGGAVDLVNPCDRDEFAEAMIKTYTDPQHAEELRKQADRWHHEAPTWDLRARLLADFIQRIGAAR